MVDSCQLLLHLSRAEPFGKDAISRVEPKLKGLDLFEPGKVNQLVQSKERERAPITYRCCFGRSQRSQLRPLNQAADISRRSTYTCCSTSFSLFPAGDEQRVRSAANLETRCQHVNAYLDPTLGLRLSSTFRDFHDRFSPCLLFLPPSFSYFRGMSSIAVSYF